MLAWDVAAWVLPRLDPEARTRIEGAVRDAVEELRRDAAIPVCPEAVQLAGFPDREHALALFERLAPTLWAA